MAYLIVEDNFDSIISGVSIDESTKDKQYYIEGVFLQAEHKNRNGRIYPVNILEREVNRFTRDYINKNRSLGELNHPKSPSVNPERACHFIKSLRREGNNWIGKSLITSTPVGSVVKGLLDDGVQLGVSSRGLGTLSEKQGIKMVNEDYYMSTIDVVSDPSAPDAWVNGIYEGKEWAVQGEDDFVEKVKKQIDKESNSVNFGMFEQHIILEKMNEFFSLLSEKPIPQGKIIDAMSDIIGTKNEFKLGLSIERYINAKPGDKVFSTEKSIIDEMLKRMNIQSYGEYYIKDIKDMKKDFKKYLHKIGFESKWKYDSKNKVYIRL